VHPTDRHHDIILPGRPILQSTFNWEVLGRQPLEITVSAWVSASQIFIGPYTSYFRSVYFRLTISIYLVAVSNKFNVPINLKYLQDKFCDDTIQKATANIFPFTVCNSEIIILIPMIWFTTIEPNPNYYNDKVNH
jgi:hypothetical protein